ncbi:MAG: GNAT family N-acetyltransferase [Nitrospinae bacterium]|nr:GNAT family N-acetyltransferase [Nitrospinota bacterium]
MDAPEGITITPAGGDDLPAVTALLAENSLPTEDVARHIGGFILARSVGKIAGSAGIEMFADAALLRSVAVATQFRRTGIGTALVAAMENRVRHDGIKEVYLLTETAEIFFRSRGYQTVARDSAPETIRRTREFATICPSTAVCMKKYLGK